jgi:outer membrane protein
MWRLSLAFVFALFIFRNSHAQEKWDLRKCVEYAMANNITIKQQQIQANIAGLTYKQSEWSKYPSLNFNSNLGINTGRSIDRTTNQFTTESVFYNTFSLQANVDVFNWFSKKNTIAGNKLEAEAAKLTVEQLKDDISLNIAAAYLQVLLSREQVNASRLLIGQTLSQLTNTQKLVEAGSLPELNLLEVESQLAADSSTLISAQGTETQSLLFLKSLLHLDAAVPFDIVVPPIGLVPVEPIAQLQPEDVYQSALKNLPQQQINNLRLNASRKYADAAKGAMYPSISLGGSLQTNYSNSKNNARLLGFNSGGLDTIGVVSGTATPVVTPIITPNYLFFATPYGSQLSDNFGNGIGISISVPIFNGRSARTNWEKQKLNVKSLELQSDLDKLTMKQDIYKAYTDAMTALQKFNASEKRVAAAERAFDLAGKRYSVGLLTTLDLLTNQNNLFRARIDRLSAQYDYVFKMKVLEFYKGQGIKL